MVAYTLLIAGVAALAVAIALVLRARGAAASTEPAGSDPYTVFGPRTEEDIDTDRPRPWPVLVGLIGLGSLGIGAVLAITSAGQPTAVVGPSPTPPSVLLALNPTPEPDAVAEPVDTPQPTPAPTAGAGPGSTRSSAAGGPGPAAGEAVQAPTPTPTPKPGPSVGASVSCFNGVLSLNYSLNARSGTTLSTATVSLDGATVQQPDVAGRTQYSSSYQRSSAPGSHTFTVTASGSDGGVTTRSFPVTCS